VKKHQKGFKNNGKLHFGKNIFDLKLYKEQAVLMGNEEF
jgi:hypothetical protein